MSLLGSGSVHMTGRFAKPLASKDNKPGAGEPRCQKCLQTGHWTFECKGAATYTSRPSASKQLQNPAKRKYLDPSEVPEWMRYTPKELEEKRKAEAEARRKERKKKRKQDSSSSSSSSSSSDSDSSTSSSSSGTSSGSPSGTSSSSGTTSSSSDSGSSGSSDSSSSDSSGDSRSKSRPRKRSKKAHQQSPEPPAAAARHQREHNGGHDRRHRHVPEQHEPEREHQRGPRDRDVREGDDRQLQRHGSGRSRGDNDREERPPADAHDRAGPSRGHRGGGRPGSSSPGSGGRRPDGRVDGRAAAAVAEPEGGKQRQGHVGEEDHRRTQHRGREEADRQDRDRHRGRYDERGELTRQRSGYGEEGEGHHRRQQHGGREEGSRQQERAARDSRRVPGQRSSDDYSRGQQQQLGRGESIGRHREQPEARDRERWQPDSEGDEQLGGRWGDDEDDRGGRGLHRVGSRDLDRRAHDRGYGGGSEQPGCEREDRRGGRERERQQPHSRPADTADRDGYRRRDEAPARAHRGYDDRDRGKGRASPSGSSGSSSSGSSGSSSSSGSRGKRRGARVPLRRGHARSRSRSRSGGRGGDRR